MEETVTVAATAVVLNYTQFAIVYRTEEEIKISQKCAGHDI
jgi:hypothetical protein